MRATQPRRDQRPLRAAIIHLTDVLGLAGSGVIHPRFERLDLPRRALIVQEIAVGSKYEHPVVSDDRDQTVHALLKIIDLYMSPAKRTNPPEL